MKVYIEFYARPLTKEHFSLEYHPIVFDESSVYLDDDIQWYLDDDFWDEFKTRMYEKSFYKFVGILDIKYTKYHNYEGDVDAIITVDKVILLERASSFAELVNVLDNLGIVENKRTKKERKVS